MITAFLSDRKQQVVLDGAYSNLINVLYGVLKGTVLGPLLFVAYINDMPDSPRSSDARLCADDSLVYRTFNAAKGKTLLQEDLAALEEWESLVLNPITVYSYGFFFNCTMVDQASDSMTALT